MANKVWRRPMRVSAGASAPSPGLASRRARQGLRLIHHQVIVGPQQGAFGGQIRAEEGVVDHHEPCCVGFFPRLAGRALSPMPAALPGATPWSIPTVLLYEPDLVQVDAPGAQDAR